MVAVGWLVVGVCVALAGLSEAAEPYKIGFIGAVTGYGSFIGDPEAKAAKLRVKLQNQQGGIGGRPIELVVYDSEGSAEKAVLAMKRLITQDKVVAVVGPDFSSTVRAVIPIVEEAKIVTYVMTPVIKPGPGSYMFAVYPIQEYAYEAAVKWLKRQNRGTLGVLASTDTTGQEGVKFMRELAGRYGLTLKIENFNIQDTDVTAQLLSLQRGGADALMAAVSGKPFAVVAKGMKQLDMKTPLIASTGAVSKTLGDLIKGIEPETLVLPTLKMFVPEQLPANDENRPAVMNLLRLYRQEYNDTPDFYAGAGWDPTDIVLKALAAVGPDSAKMRDYIENLKGYVGTICTVNMRPDDHHGCGPEAYVLLSFKEGKFQLLPQ
jgi:branched-chain amino acid transport system substrate-binding protein